jgi:TrmH family RNA methyltransferase
METITSTRNPRLKELRKLRERKHRERSGLFAAEGEDMLASALRHGAQPERLYYDADRLDRANDVLASLPPDVQQVPVAGDALSAAGSLGHGARVVGVWRERWSELAPGGAQAAVYLHEVSDPGNVGAVVRSAHALLPSIVVLSPGTADPFAPKAVRASMGAIFGQPIVRADFASLREALGERWRAVALEPNAERALLELSLESPVLFALGAERAGLSNEVAAACDERVRVPLEPGGPESLNVAMTATVCLYETAVHRLRSH